MSVEDVRPGRFEERLLAELRTLVAERGPDARERPSGRPRGLAARRGTRLAAAAAIAVVVLGVAVTGLLRGLGDGAPPAYAVTRNVDGSITVEVRSLRDAGGLERALRAEGVPAVVVYTPPGTTCRRPWFTPARMHVAVAVGSGVSRSDGSARFTIRQHIPRGDTLVIATTGRTRSHGAVFGALEVAVAHGAVGACRLVAAPPPGPAQ